MLFTRLIGWLIRKRFWVLTALIGVTAVSAWLTSRLQLRSGFEDLLPPEFQSVKILKEIPKRVGGPGFLILGVVGEDLAALQRFAEALTPRLEELSTLRYVIYKRENDFISDHRMLYLGVEDLEDIHTELVEEIDRQKLDKNPFYFSLEEEEEASNLKSQIESYEEQLFGSDLYFVTPENKRRQQIMLAMLLKPRGFPSDIPFSRRLLAEVDDAINATKSESFHPSIYVYPLGAYRFNEMEYTQLKRDIGSSLFLALVLIAMMLLLYFKSWRLLAWIALPPLTGLIWTFGLTYLLIGYLTTQTAFMAAILLGLVVDASIHLSNHYLQAKDRLKGDNVAAVKQAMQSSFRPIAAAIFTTSGAFFTLTLTDFLAFKHFGIIGGLGLILCAISTYFVFGLLAVFFPLQRVIFRRNLWVRFIRFLSSDRVPLRAPITLLAVVAIVVVWSVVNTANIQFEYNIDNLKARSVENERHLDMLKEVFPQGLTPTVMMPKNLEQAREIQQLLDAKIERGEITTVDRVETVYSIVPDNQEEKLAVVAKIRALFSRHRKTLEKEYGAEEVNLWERWLNVSSIGLEDLPESLRRLFVGVDGSFGLFVNIYPNVNTNDGKNLARYAGEVYSVETSQGRVYSGGEQIIFADMLDLMNRDGKRALIYSLLFIVFILFVLYRRVVAVVTVLTPLLVGTILLCGCMAYFDIKLNFFNFIVFPSIIGIGVDNGIHIYNRFQRFPNDRIRIIMQTTGGAITMTSLTTVIGFATLMLAKNQALVSVGLLAVVGVGLCWICSITVLPAILKLQRRLTP